MNSLQRPIRNWRLWQYWLFLFPVTLTAHSFWQASGTAAFTPQLLNSFNNTGRYDG